MPIRSGLLLQLHAALFDCHMLSLERTENSGRPRAGKSVGLQLCHCTKMRLLELFSGTKLVGGAFEALGWEVGPLLIVPENEPTGRLIPQAERTGTSLHVRTQSGGAGGARQPRRQGVQGGCELRQVWVMSNQCGLLLEVTDLQLKTYEAPKTVRFALLEHAQELEKFEPKSKSQRPCRRV